MATLSNVSKSSTPSYTNTSRSSVSITNANKNSSSYENTLRSLGDRWSTITTTWASEIQAWGDSTPTQSNESKNTSTYSNEGKS